MDFDILTGQHTWNEIEIRSKKKLGNMICGKNCKQMEKQNSYFCNYLFYDIFCGVRFIKREIFLFEIHCMRKLSLERYVVVYATEVR